MTRTGLDSTTWSRGDAQRMAGVVLVMRSYFKIRHLTVTQRYKSLLCLKTPCNVPDVSLTNFCLFKLKPDLPFFIVSACSSIWFHRKGQAQRGQVDKYRHHRKHSL